MISRLHSFDAPVELEVGMVFALETYCAATDGRSAARIEEEVDRHARPAREVLTRFPAAELLVAGRNYVRGADLVDGELVPTGNGGATLAAAPSRQARSGRRAHRVTERRGGARVAERTLIKGGTVITRRPGLGDSSRPATS